MHIGLLLLLYVSHNGDKCRSISPPMADVFGAWATTAVNPVPLYERAIFNTGIPILGGSISKISIVENGPILPSLPTAKSKPLGY